MIRKSASIVSRTGTACSRNILTSDPCKHHNGRVSNMIKLVLLSFDHKRGIHSTPLTTKGRLSRQDIQPEKPFYAPPFYPNLPSLKKRRNLQPLDRPIPKSLEDLTEQEKLNLSKQHKNEHLFYDSITKTKKSHLFFSEKYRKSQAALIQARSSHHVDQNDGGSEQDHQIARIDRQEQSRNKTDFFKHRLGNSIVDGQLDDGLIQELNLNANQTKDPVTNVSAAIKQYQFAEKTQKSPDITTWFQKQYPHIRSYDRLIRFLDVAKKPELAVQKLMELIRDRQEALPRLEQTSSSTPEEKWAQLFKDKDQEQGQDPQAQLSVPNIVEPDEITYVAVIASCAHAKWVQGAEQAYQAALSNLGSTSISLRCALANAYVEAEDIRSAMQILGKEEKLIDPTLGLSAAKWSQKPVYVSGDGAVDFDTIGYDINVVGWTTLLKYFVRKKDFANFQGCFEMMKLRGVQPDEIAYNMLLTGYARNDHFNLAIQTYKEMEVAGCLPDEATYCALIQAYAKRKDAEGALQVLRRAATEGITINRRIRSSLMYALGKSGNWSAAEKIFDGITQRDAYDYSILMYSYSRGIWALICKEKTNDFGSADDKTVNLINDKADKMILNMKENKIEINRRVVNSYIAVKTACRKMTDALEIFKEYFRVKNEQGKSLLQPDKYTYTTMIRGYGEIGRADLGYHVLKCMLKDPSVAKDDIVPLLCTIRSCLISDELQRAIHIVGLFPKYQLSLDLATSEHSEKFPILKDLYEACLRKSEKLAQQLVDALRVQQPNQIIPVGMFNPINRSPPSRGKKLRSNMKGVNWWAQL